MKNNSRSNLRKVKFKLNNATDTTFENGFFHEWSVEYEELENGVGQFPVAIIEDETGYIHALHTSMMVFVDQNEQS